VRPRARAQVREANKTAPRHFLAEKNVVYNNNLFR
jgi:hypothetical protein